MVDSDRRYVVTGRGPVAEEIAFVMKKLGFPVKTWARIQALDSPDLHAFSEDLGVIGRQRPARVDVVSVWPSGTSPSEVTQSILRLRGGLLWEGCFTAVMLTAADRESLAAAPLLPGSEPGETYSRVRGHIALSVPVDLPDLLRVLDSERPLYLEEWSRLSHRSVFGPLCSAHHRLASALDAGAMNEALEVAQEALETLGSTEWWILAPDHQWERTARSMIRNSRERKGSIGAFCIQVLDLLNRVVDPKAGAA